MRIGFVAVGTRIVRDGSFEVTALVATGAGNVEMLAHQGEVCFGVIKGRGEVRLLPRESGVAGIAARFEFPFVRIAMTV